MNPRTRLLEQIQDPNAQDLFKVVCRKNGSDLLHFLGLVDCEHPDFSLIFSDDEQLLFVDLIDAAKNLQGSLVLDHLYKAMSSSLKQKIKSLKNPLSKHVRMIKSPVDRARARLAKKIQYFSLDRTLDEVSWLNHPEDFSIYGPDSDFADSEVEKATKRADKYKRLRCESLAEEIMKGVEDFKEVANDTHYGYRRLQAPRAAVIVAKRSGFYYAQSKDGRAYPRISTHKFWDFVEEPSPHFGLESQMIPLHSAGSLPDEVAKLVEHLDAHPDANGKPVFDHYVFVCPGVRLGPIPTRFKSGDSFAFKDHRGKVNSCWTPQALRHSFNRACMVAGVFKPVLLGEVNGKCYYLWSGDE